MKARPSCIIDDCANIPSRGLAACSRCLSTLKRAHFPGVPHAEMLRHLDQLSRQRALTDDESLLLELAIRQLTPSERDVVRKNAQRRADGVPRRGRPFGSVNGQIGDAIDERHVDRLRNHRIAKASEKLLQRMLSAGSKAGGCLDLSAAQCRARLGETV